MKEQWYEVRFENDDFTFIVKAIGPTAACAKARDFLIAADTEPESVPLHGWTAVAINDERNFMVLE